MARREVFIYVKENIGDRSKDCFGEAGSRVKIDLTNSKLWDIEDSEFTWSIDNIDKGSTDIEIVDSLNEKFNKVDDDFITIFKTTTISIIVNGDIVNIGKEIKLIDYITSNIRLKGNPVIEYNGTILRSDNMFNSYIILHEDDVVNIWYEKDEINLSQIVDNS